jgi:hypothetical protein
MICHAIETSFTGRSFPGSVVGFHPSGSEKSAPHNWHVAASLESCFSQRGQNAFIGHLPLVGADDASSPTAAIHTSMGEAFNGPIIAF